ncbi:hypothetical protein M427DRAFT_151189 [Gonapodya prolifera JEL478]|uniref:Protein NO VEIN C-terminal domain-containing protein n=1 Tax=Gonapodya prolifera (strain JEL478) TaxID=1344416 RepID=A0A139AZ10_GONPJ|nr:hypothetical protein M427DRAFT_151189 [Gonapodya prolifera JEL478]|eukprot:KXS21944.1 hypothetical protein M427DRAFT_151189 [Gonapodya prolifera JEL478]
MRTIERASSSGSRVVEVTSADGSGELSSNRWLVARESIDFPAWCRKDTEADSPITGELALAFSFNVPTDPQPAFAYLPLRPYGLKFIVQGDFAVPSSREDIDQDHPRNVFLRNEIPRLFVEAFKLWIELSDEFHQQSLESHLQTFLEFIPEHAEGFMRPIVYATQAAMKATHCLLTSEGLLVSPSSVLQLPQDHFTLGLDVRSIITSDNLWNITGKRWLKDGLVVGDALRRMLEIDTLGVEHLSAIAGSDMFQSRGEMLTLFARLVEARCRTKHERTDLELVRSTRMFALANGGRVHLGDDNVFFPDDSKGMGMKQYEFMEDLRVLDARMFPANEAHRSSVVWLLEHVGVKHRDAHDVIRYHLIPRFRNNLISQGPKLLSCIRYLKEHTSTCDKCASDIALFDELGQILQIPTTCGWCCVRGNRGVYLPSNLSGFFDLSDANFIDVIILDLTGLMRDESAFVDEWRRFFRRLGCLEWFTPVKEMRVFESTSELSQFVGRNAIINDSIGEGPWSVSDYVCPDMEAVLLSFTSEEDQSIEKLQGLKSIAIKFGQTFDAKWMGSLSFYKNGVVHDRNGAIQGVSFYSNFVVSLREHPWMPTHKGFFRPSDLFLPLEDTKELVGDLVLYSPMLKEADFASTIGLRRAITLSDVEHVLLSDLPLRVSTMSGDAPDLELIRRTYELLRFLTESLDGTAGHIWSDKDIVYFPRLSPERVPSGGLHILRCPSELIWTDPAQVGDLGGPDIMQNLLEPLYGSFARAKEVFLALKVSEVPAPLMYIQTLVHVAESNEGFRNRVATARRIMETLTERLMVKRDRANVEPSTSPWKTAESEQIVGEQEMVKEQLGSLPIFPSHRGQWVTLSCDDIFINDDPYIAEQLDDPSLHFLFSIKDEINGNLSATPTTVRRLLEALGVRRLTQMVTVIPDTSDAEFNDTWDHRLVHVMPFLQRYLYSFRRDVYVSSGQRIQGLLESVPVMKASNFRVHYKLKTCTSPLVSASCALTGLDSSMPALYVDALSESELGDVFLEFTRLMDPSHRPDPDMARFLTLICTMATNGVALFCQNEGVDAIPETEPLWIRVPKRADAGVDTGATEDDLVMLPSDYGGQRPRKGTDGITDEDQRNGGGKRKAETDAIDVDGEGDMDEPNAKRARVTNPVPALGVSAGSGDNSAQLDFRGRKLMGPITNTTVGRLGEKLVAEKLRAEHAGSADTRIVWINEEEESGERWDIEIITMGEDGEVERVQYVEVKTTRGADKSWFEISHREFFWALDMGENFTLVRVFLNIENSEGDLADFDPVFLTLDNFAQKFRDGKVKLRAEI